MKTDYLNNYKTSCCDSEWYCESDGVYRCCECGKDVSEEISEIEHTPE